MRAVTTGLKVGNRCSNEVGNEYTPVGNASAPPRPPFVWGL
jgi:hypothetical protein